MLEYYTAERQFYQLPQGTTDGQSPPFDRDSFFAGRQTKGALEMGQY